jgi:hypothetical protein
MRGQEKVIEMRLRGKKPAMVFLNDWPCRTDWFETGDHATISTDGDPTESLDMRFLVGTAVSISSESESRAKALYEACKRHCDIVAAHVHQPGVWPNRQNGWTAVWRRDSGSEVSNG